MAGYERATEQKIKDETLPLRRALLIWIAGSLGGWLVIVLTIWAALGF